jgi:hypothetical protein
MGEDLLMDPGDCMCNESTEEIIRRIKSGEHYGCHMCEKIVEKVIKKKEWFDAKHSKVMRLLDQRFI